MLKDKVERRERMIGTSLLGASVDNAEVLALAGLDFLVIHHGAGAGAVAAVLARLGAIKGSGCIGLVRTPADDRDFLAQIRAAGAGGILVPEIASAERARDVVAACRVAGTGGEPFFIALQVQSGAAIGEIAAIPGVDLVFIDPRDRAAEHALRAAGMPLACAAADAADAAALFQRGYAFVIAGSDMMLLDAGASALLAAARTGAAGAVFQPAAAGAVSGTLGQRDANTSIRRMRQFWVAWCVAVLLLGAAVVGFGYLFSLSEAWEPWAKIGARAAAGLLAALAVYDAYRIATRGTAALQEVLAQNLASIVIAELERLHAAAAQRKLALAAKDEPGTLGLRLASWSFDGEDVRNLLGNPTEQALRDVLTSIDAYNRLIDTLAPDDPQAETGLARQIEEISAGINRAMASVTGRLDDYRQAARAH
jgi:4-hydroxy-2-oxoheptanedioate aldolase